MRVTQNMLYGNALKYMNSSLADLVRLNEQSATQKKVNKASDDPAAMATILDARSGIADYNQYERNIDTSTGWLSLADQTLQQASTTITSVIEQAEQASTGTLTDDQRLSVAQQVRQEFNHLVALANTEYVGQSIFAGHKTDENAFSIGLGATVSPDLASGASGTGVLRVGGDAEQSIMVRFEDDGTVGGAADIAYRYSSDGGETWTDGTLAAGETTLDLGSAEVTLGAGTAITAETDDAEGSTILVRPAAVYLGDDEDGATVQTYGSPPVTTTLTGNFAGEVLVRIDEDTQLSDAVSYSYSLDDGATWVEGNVASGARLPLPGGVLTLASNGGDTLSAGDQFAIRPHEADIDLEISRNEYVTVNNVGKDVFGGLYDSNGDGVLENAMADSPDKNLLEVVANLIGALESNDLDAVAECRDQLTEAQGHILAVNSDVGARENRVGFAASAVDVQQANAATLLSRVEDADASEILTELQQAQTIYQAVLGTSTKVLSLSLVDYL